MGGKVAVMTATLPPFIKDLLMENIPFKKENIATFVNDLSVTIWKSGIERLTQKRLRDSTAETVDQEKQEKYWSYAIRYESAGDV